MSHQKTNKFNGSRPDNRGAPRTGKGPRRADTATLREFLDGLSLHVTPSIKINGPQHSTAVISVDFGSPLQQVRLNPEQSQELTRRMRSLTRDLYKDEVNVRVSSDHQNGVWWTSIQ